jgi:hypothetical protein
MIYLMVRWFCSFANKLQRPNHVRLLMDNFSCNCRVTPLWCDLNFVIHPRIVQYFWRSTVFGTAAHRSFPDWQFIWFSSPSNGNSLSSVNGSRMNFLRWLAS